MSTVTIKRIKKGQLHSQVGKAAFSNAKTYFTVGIDPITGDRVRIFDPEKDEDKVSKYATALGRTKEDLYNPTSDFWRDYVERKTGEVFILNKSNVKDAFLLDVLKKDKLVAFGEDELLTKAQAEYLVISEEAVIAKKNEKAKYKKEAYTIFGAMSPEDMRNALLVYGYNPKDMSDDKVSADLIDKLDENPANFLLVVKDKNFDNKVFINDMIQESIVRKSGSSFIFDGETIAHDLESMLEFIKNPANQTVVVAFKQALNKKKGSAKYE